MPTANFSNTDILKNPVLIETATWDTTQIPGTELISFTLPAIFATLDTFHTRMLQVYSYFKPHVNLHFIINPTKFHQGKLIAFYDPMETTVPSGTLLKRRVRNQFMATGQPNVILDAGYANTGVIQIPFEHVLSYMTTNSTERAPQMGTVYLMVLNPLNVSVGATAELDVQIMLSCSDVELHLPIRPHAIELISLAEEEPLQLESMDNIKPSRGITAVTSAIMDAPKNMADFYGNLFTGNWNGVGEALGNAWDSTINGAKGLLQIFGMDKPAHPMARTSNRLATVAPLSHMKGVDNSVRLAATPIGGYTKMDFSSTNPGEMNIKQIIMTKMMFRQDPWDTTMAQGVSLLRIPVHPALSYSTVDPSGFTRLQPTFLSYMSLAFEQWHGSINFRFDFAATQFHTGRILAVFEPNSSTTGAVDDLVHYTNNPSHLFDLHENKTFEINIPFVSSTPRKNTSNPTALTDFATNDEVALGWLSLYVYTPLAVSNNVPNSIQFNSYISAGDDFVFEIPRIREDVYFPDSTLPTLPLELEAMEALPLRSEDRSSPPSIIKGSGVTATTTHYNEEIGDVRDYARRYGRSYQGVSPWNVSTAPLNYIKYNISNNLSNANSSPATNSAQIPLYFISALFTFYSGSLRYKYIPISTRNTPLTGTVVNLLGKTTTAPIAGTGPFSFVQGAGRSYPTQKHNLTQDSALEVEVPFYSFYNQFLVNPIQTTGNFNDLIYGSGTTIILAETDDPTAFPAEGLSAEVYDAAGDDFKLRFLVSPPQILIQTLS
jgi:hypothetical protein